MRQDAPPHKFVTEHMAESARRHVAFSQMCLKLHIFCGNIATYGDLDQIEEKRWKAICLGFESTPASLHANKGCRWGDMTCFFAQWHIYCLLYRIVSIHDCHVQKEKQLTGSSCLQCEHLPHAIKPINRRLFCFVRLGVQAVEKTYYGLLSEDAEAVIPMFANMTKFGYLNRTTDD